MLYAPKRLRFEKDIITRIFRNLPGQGSLNIQVGQELTPAEIIGSAIVSSGFRTINLASQLSVTPKDVKKYLKVGLGQKIYKGELLAYKEGGLFSSKKVVVSPTDGILDFFNINSGEVRMSFLPKRVNLVAGVYGVVDGVDEKRGAVSIRTQVTRVYGLVGTGRVRDGILRKIGGREDLISSSKISVKDTEHILLGGSIVFKEAIEDAISAGIHGIITGGLNAQDFRGMAGGRLIFPRKLESDIGITIVACEGFGSIPIGEDIYQILLEFDEKFVTLDGNRGIINLPSFSSSSMKKIRSTSLPKMVDFTTYANPAQPDSEEVKGDQKVRFVGSLYRGGQGKIISINGSKTQLASGLEDFLVTVETKSRKIQMPSANIEIIE
ncbi:hypothetical protein HYT18_01580 [Candidatus Microgenomates bacterium]|nr:hypothetical protein [Candidatus Microgenomates bacterium]